MKGGLVLVALTAAVAARAAEPPKRVVSVNLSADEVLSIREAELEVAADEPTDRRVNGISEARNVGKLGDSRDRKPIAVRVDGLKESVAPRVIANRVADLTHRAGQTRIRYEHARPDPLEQLLLRERARAILDQDLQELEGLRR